MNKKMKILVVDDDRQMVKTICDILQFKEFETLPAYSGEEAVDKINNDVPDCVLMDLKMPGMNGVETLKIIKGVSPETPVVLMSAYASAEQSKEANLLGVVTILTKPVDLQQLLSLLALLENKKSVLISDDDATDLGDKK